MAEYHVLSLLLCLPFVGALFCGLIWPQRNAGLLKGFAFAVMLLNFLIALSLFVRFEPKSGLQFVENYAWITEYGISYYIGLDGLNLLMVLVTTLLMPVALLSAWHRLNEKNAKVITGLLLFLEGSLLGAYVSLDVFLFYVFYETMLIPMVLLIFFYGGHKRAAAALKFFIYTVAGSLLMLIALLVIYFRHYSQFGFYSANIYSLAGVNIPADLALKLFLTLLLAFAIKSPVFPFHSWLPDAYVEAPHVGSIVLAGLMGKVGIYGLFRIALPLFPAQAVSIAPAMAVLAVIAVIYGALIATVQTDLKRLAAFLSFSHVGTIVLGVFVGNLQGYHGAVIQMANHALIIAAIFIMIGVLEDRRGSRQIQDFGGLSARVPGIATVMMIVMLAAVGLPGLNGFIGEVLILFGAFKYNLVFGILAATGMVTGAVCMFRMYEKVMFGPIGFSEIPFPDLKACEWLALIILLIPIVWIGICPGTFLKKIEPDLKLHLVAIERQTNLIVAGQAKVPLASEQRMMSDPVNTFRGRP